MLARTKNCKDTIFNEIFGMQNAQIVFENEKLMRTSCTCKMNFTFSNKDADKKNKIQQNKKTKQNLRLQVCVFLIFFFVDILKRAFGCVTVVWSNVCTMFFTSIFLFLHLLFHVLIQSLSVEFIFRFYSHNNFLCETTCIFYPQRFISPIAQMFSIS